MCTYERFGWTLFSAFVVSQNSTDCCDLTVLTVAVINSINCLIENYNSAQFCLACMHILSLQCFQYEGIFFWEWEGKEKLIIITFEGAIHFAKFQILYYCSCAEIYFIYKISARADH